MPYLVDIAVAAPVWRPLTYAVADDLAPLVGPLTRVLAPLRGRGCLGFALGSATPGDTAGFKPLQDVLDEPGRPVWPAGLLPFFQRAATYYQAPLGQALAWALPAGLGEAKGAGRRVGLELVMVAAWRPGPPETAPKPGGQAAELLALLREQGPQPLPVLRQRFGRAAALVRSLEAAGWVGLSHRALVRDLLGQPLWPEPEPEALTADQTAALAAITPAITEKRFQSFLLHGVTGSGKTEVYLAACRAALEAGRGAIILTPEIGLCLRLEGLLRDRLGPERVAVLHSGLTPAQRREQWWTIAQGPARVVVGARSAVFAPLADPGLICVDEEQDEAYKQEDRLRYHGRDLALLRGREQGCPVVLGSATPSVVTWWRAQRGELTRLSLPRRVREAALPVMEVVDLRGAGKLEAGFLGRRLKQGLIDTVAAGHQAIVFLNRRGFAPALICTACGKSLGCPACALSLTLHQQRQRLVCHTCGHQRPVPPQCPNCGAAAESFKPLGLGTEAVAGRLQELFPEWRVGRLDRDTAETPQQLRRILKAVAGHELDVLVGTQMLTKGHHFPLIRLVGVLLADQALTLPDYRAAERAFVLLTQVAGRAGREGGPGRVIVQSYDPGHHAVAAALAHDAEGFYAKELEQRRELSYPPFSRLMALRLEGVDEDRVRRAAEELGMRLEAARRRIEPRAQLLGPAPAAVARAAGRWRYLLLLKSASAAAAARVLRLGLHQAGDLPSGVRLIVDVDPLNLS